MEPKVVKYDYIHGPQYKQKQHYIFIPLQQKVDTNTNQTTKNCLNAILRHSETVFAREVMSVYPGNACISA